MWDRSGVTEITLYVRGLSARGREGTNENHDLCIASVMWLVKGATVTSLLCNGLIYKLLVIIMLVFV